MAARSLKLYVYSLLATLAVGGLAWQAGLFERSAPGDEAMTAARQPAEIEAADEASAEAGADEQETAAAPAEPATGGETPAGVEEAAAEVVTPRFDVVRVEPNGDVVIAGNAAGSATVEIISGKRVLGTGKAGEEGDFVATLDTALTPGDYMLVLRATAPDGTVAMSAETAIVSVPEDKSGQVLAIVDEPGKPSKLITVPVASEEDATGTETATGSDTATGSETASETPAEPEAVAEAPASDDAEASASDAAPAITEPEVESAGTPAGEEGEQADEAPETVARVDDAPATVQAEPKPEEQPAAAAEPAPAAKPGVLVEAVEIEGNYVFVAGRAEGGKIVRVYANKDLIGETEVSEGGRFLVESTRGLAVGDYIIRADLLGLGSAEVLARAAVPFEREPGDSVAAVAPGLREAGEEELTYLAEAATDVARDDGGVAVPVGEPSAEAADETGAETGAEDSAVVEDDTTAGPEAGAKQAAGPVTPSVSDAVEGETDAPSGEAAAPAAPSETEPASEVAAADGDESDAQVDAAPTATDADTDAALPEDEPAAVAEPDMASEPDTASGAEEAPETGSDVTAAEDLPASQDMPAAQDMPATDDRPAESGAAPDASTSEAMPASEPAGTAPASGEETAEEAPGDAPASAAPEIADEDITITAPPLERASGAVIIRRGDTLWRISRRVYGRGIRYSTIYAANRDQIADPDRIWPGQIFDVPAVSDDGAAANYDAIANRLQEAPGD